MNRVTKKKIKKKKIMKARKNPMWAVGVLCLRSAGARLERAAMEQLRSPVFCTPLPAIPPCSSAGTPRSRLPSSPSTHFPLISSAIPTTKKWLHTVPAFNFFVPGATPHFLQLLLKAWPFHLLHSHRISLSSHNLTTSRDPAPQLQSHLQALSSVYSPLRFPLFN